MACAPDAEHLRRYRRNWLSERAKSTPRQAAFDVETVLAIRIGMSSERRREVRQVFVTDRDTVSSQHVECFGHVDGVPRDHCVGDEIEAECLHRLVLVFCPTDLAFVREEEEPTEVVQRLALVELDADSPSILRAIEAANDVRCLDQSPVFLECAQHRVLAAVALKFADQE
jgi:hypothetical protein